ncbi:MAG TPA: PepSY domain-containing protein [Pilimelia sp.]|nr:PepSY domain-containing protein [Pilimelia sp.]
MRKAVLAAAVAAAALGVGSVSYAVTDPDPRRPAGLATASPSGDAVPDDSPTAETSLGPASGGPAAIHVEHAKALAEQAAGGGRAAKVELEWEHGRLVWSIEVLRGSAEYDIDVDAENGQVVRFRQDRRG